MTNEESIRQAIASREAEQLNLHAEQETLLKEYSEKIPKKMYRSLNRLRTGLVLLQRKIEDPTEHQDKNGIQEENSTKEPDSRLKRLTSLEKELDVLVQQDELLKNNLSEQQ